MRSSTKSGRASAKGGPFVWPGIARTLPKRAARPNQIASGCFASARSMERAPVEAGVGAGNGSRRSHYFGSVTICWDRPSGTGETGRGLAASRGRLDGAERRVATATARSAAAHHGGYAHGNRHLGSIASSVKTLGPTGAHSRNLHRIDGSRPSPGPAAASNSHASTGDGRQPGGASWIAARTRRPASADGRASAVRNRPIQCVQ